MMMIVGGGNKDGGNDKATRTVMAGRQTGRQTGRLPM